mmetsp:Transcript_1009/g.1958  ORF Transcript_1009/g.1958 Transcript_1009/m.1958 type:complete len:301 (-) Transcript_1009:742-1644(-)
MKFQRVSGSVVFNATMSDEINAEVLLEEYLSSTLPREWPRVECCGSSRSLYCPECFRILIPRENWPSDLREGTMKFPFHIDIVLGKKERKTCATGVQVAAIAGALESTEDSQVEPSLSLQKDENRLESNGTEMVKLYSFECNNIPTYDPDIFPNTYVLFPEQGSVPITSVEKIDRLIVLDIKWSKQSGKTDSRFRSFPRVHLDSPPDQSHYWRWHSEGFGMLSTIEAIYFAAMEATTDWNVSDRRRLINIMWLFAAQHAIVKKKSEIEDRCVPFSEGAKIERRLLRQLHPNHPSRRAILR